MSKHCLLVLSLVVAVVSFPGSQLDGHEDHPFPPMGIDIPYSGPTSRVWNTSPGTRPTTTLSNSPVETPAHTSQLEPPASATDQPMQSGHSLAWTTWLIIGLLTLVFLAGVLVMVLLCLGRQELRRWLQDANGQGQNTMEMPTRFARQ